jgi:hypothetical protein
MGTTVAEYGLVVFTAALVIVTWWHARTAEKQVRAADKLGEVLDRQSEILARHAIATAWAAAQTKSMHHATHLDDLAIELRQLIESRGAR